jgi:hypothetical protein
MTILTISILQMKLTALELTTQLFLNQEANLIRMDDEIEAVGSDDAEDSDFQTDSNSELEEEDDEVDDEEDNQE